MLFSVSSSDIFQQLKGLYNVVECTKSRKAKSDEAHYFRGDGKLGSIDLSRGQAANVQAWLTQLHSGSKDLLAKVLEKFEASESNNVLERTLAPSVVASGPYWSCCNFSDFMFGRTVICLWGTTFIAGIPFDFFDVEKTKKDISTVSESMGNMSRSELVENGGFYAYLEAFEAVTMPPGYLYFQANTGTMDLDDGTCAAEPSGCDFLVAWF